MPPGMLTSELEQIGRTLLRWKAEIKFFFWSVIALGFLWLSGIFDLFLQFERTGRILSWLIILSFIGVAFWRTSKVLARRYTIQSVASIVESHFPQLDNKLINYLQFSNDSSKDPFKEAYVRRGVPEWSSVNVGQMRNRKAYMWSMIGMAVAVVLLAAPISIQGRAWVVSLWRIVNPFSNVQPISLTNIVSVEPGNITVLQGNPAIVLCKVQGKRGHFVSLDIKPSDNNKTTYVLGRIDTGDIKEWTYRIPKVTTDMEYRFRAGDSPSPKWFKIKSRAPLAFVKISLDVKPPSYTGILPKTFDGMGEAVQIFQGSEVDVTIKCNSAASSITLSTKGSEPLVLTQGENDKTWVGKLNIKDGNLVKVSAIDNYKETAEATINYELFPDKTPVVQITQPKGRVTLGPNGMPNIEFTVSDDYGIADVTIEKVTLSADKAKTKDATGIPLKSWQNVEGRTFSQQWKDPDLKPTKTEALAFRIVAKDNYPLGGHVVQSPLIIFDNGTITSEEKKTANVAQAKIIDTLGKITDLQKSNLANTKKYQDALAITKAEQWLQVQEQQKTIRALANEILRNPTRPLGSMTANFQELYEKEMLEVISFLGRTGDPKETEANKKLLALKSVIAEEKILRQLSYAEAVADKTSKSRKISGLISMLDALVNGETKVLAATRDFATKGAKIGKPLVAQQDNLAADTAEFAKACVSEAATITENDKNLAQSINKVATECENKKIRDDMLKAGEMLDANNPKSAEPSEVAALTKLKELQDMLKQGQLAEAAEDKAKLAGEIHLVKEKLEKLAALEGKVIDAMKAMEAQKDMSGEERDKLEEEVKELKKNMEEAMLQVPVDLNIFKELPVVNDMLEDVFSIFEEVKMTQEEAADIKKAGTMITATLANQEFLNDMKTQSGRLDDLETWLSQNDKQEKKKFLAETFDKEELKFMASGALAASQDDIIGDLAKQADKEAKKDDDASATNVPMKDLPMGWEAAEGNQAGFMAKGKSGNQAPDHKEQDGRSNIGRQGMASGETASGSGTIGKGDKNIEERMTPEPLQSGKVQLDGEADTKATGGGKQASGQADGQGMTGSASARRMDSDAQGTAAGVKSLMEKVKAVHVKASLMNLRTDQLGNAAHHLRQADEAFNRGMPISELKELLKKTTVDLKRGSTDLGAGTAGSIDSGAQADKLEDVVEGGSDQAPKAYKDLVSEYYKALNDKM